MNSAFWDTFIASAFGAGLITFLYKILEKFLDEWRADVKSKRTEKKEYAKELLAICNEASSSVYSALPRNREHINAITTLSERLAPDLTKDLEQLNGSWVLYAYRGSQIKGSPSKEDIDFGNTLMTRADGARKRIIKKAHLFAK